MAAGEPNTHRGKSAEREKEYRDQYDGNGKGSDEENAALPRHSVGEKGKQDPFGDESNSEVKYRTMEWWLVSTLHDVP